MHTIEEHNGILSGKILRESTHFTTRNGRSGTQQYVNRGFGKIKNTDYEPLHYQDT